MKREKLVHWIIDNAFLIILIVLVIVLWGQGHFSCKCPIYECANGVTNMINWSVT